MSPYKNPRYVVILDILGFKELVKNNSHKHVFTFIEKVVKKTLTHGLSINNTEILGKSKINLLSLSDSIILWTTDDSHKSFVHILFTVALLIRAGFDIGLVFRGALTYGELTVVKQNINGKPISVLFGKALIEAYEIEKQQEWVGCIVSEESFKRFIFRENELKNTGEKNVVSSEDLDRDSILLKYKVPLKSGKVIDAFVINWVSSLSNFNEKHFRSRFSIYNRDTTTWDVERKIINSWRFYKHAKKLVNYESV